mmetsp:Transcript_454/g.867  ORF Transcript_454/g.867 Transcript_454/m.867 type:complete len:180 (-) Transcript_454:172-711(-)
MVTYRRVASNEQSTEASALSREPPGNSDFRSAESLRSPSERISDKLHALAWVVLAYGVSSYTHLFHKMFTDDRIIRPIFHIALGLFLMNVVLTLYLTVYLPYKFPDLSSPSSKSKASASSPAFWDVYCPRVIPFMTASGVFGSFLLVRACFPVWGFSTPLILGIVALGMFFSLHFIPCF